MTILYVPFIHLYSNSSASEIARCIENGIMPQIIGSEGDICVPCDAQKAQEITAYKMYLTAIIDWCSRYIVGWELSDNLDTAPVLAAVKTVIEKHGMPAIINSDQGGPVTSEVYTAFLRKHGIRQSMDGKARWVDNIIIERWFRSLKIEYVYINEYQITQRIKSRSTDLCQGL